jgi:hypothetical protein
MHSIAAAMVKVRRPRARSRGKRRVHERPNREAIPACRVWLDGEIAQGD